MNEIDDVQAQVSDLRKTTSELDSALSCAESCESIIDLRLNLEEAMDRVSELVKEIKHLLNDKVKP